MDTLFNTYISRDVRMKLSDTLSLPIRKGPSNLSFQSLEANSKSTSEIDWSFSPPSEGTLICRNPVTEVDMTFRTTITFVDRNVNTPVAGTNMFSLGRNVCLQSFPLNRITSYTTIGVNNSQVTENVQNTLTQKLQMMNENLVREFTSLCPVMSDRHARYIDISDSDQNSPFNDYKNAYSKDTLPRGCHQIEILSVVKTATNDAQSDSLVKADGDKSFVITYKVKVIEPVLVAPFLYGPNGDNSQCFIGVNRLHIKYNLNPDCRRVLSSKLTDNTIFTTSLISVNSAKLNLLYLDGDLTHLFPERQLIPYMELVDNTYESQTTINSLETKTYQFNNLQLSVIPDRIILLPRKPISTQSALDPDVGLPTRKLSCVFNNKPSLLSDLTPNELYLMSKRNGLGNVDYYQFYGVANRYSATRTSSANPELNDLYLGGSAIVLDPARDLSISNPYLSSGSTGQFNFSFRADVFNNTSSQLTSVELVCVCVYFRILETRSGFSQITSPNFNQSQVASTIEKGVEGSDLNLSALYGGSRSGGAVSGGVAKSGGSCGGMSGVVGKSKLDSLLM